MKTLPLSVAANQTETTTMHFEKRNFMGIELDVLVGHLEHDLLFVATQVARAAGLKDPATSVSDFRHLPTHRQAPGQSLSALIGNLPVSVPLDSLGRKYRTTTILFPEANVYQMLLRGHAPASEPFRKWVTEEVLPTIRKTGSYSAEQSTNPIAQGVMDELKLLRNEVGSLRGLIEQMVAKPVAVIAPVEPSPYIGQQATTTHYHFNKVLVRTLCDGIGLSAPAADKLAPLVILNLEVAMVALWNKADGRKLDTETSSTKRVWAKFPKDWLMNSLNRTAYQAAIKQALNESLK